jgi:glycosyltransferase involved in cell wall biosynthesis
MVYIGPSCHKITKSTNFLVNYLRKFFNLRSVPDFRWKGGKSPDLSFIDKSYLGIVFFQHLPKPSEFLKIKNENIIFFPMYDQPGWENVINYDEYKNIKVVNFCKETHKRFKKWGFDSMYIQYFPKPGKFIRGNKREVYFWQRTTDMNIHTISKIFGKQKVKIHIHKAIDFRNHFIKPTKTLERRYSITYSKWFKSKYESDKLINSKSIYISPRVKEGIGMSFLDAMAAGKAVIASNNPTMNEYIIHNRTGYLFNPEKMETINLKNLDEIQKNAYKYMCEGYRKWQKEKINIIRFIKEQ